VLRYLQTAYLLHLITVASIILFVYCGRQVLVLLESNTNQNQLFVYSFLALYLLTIPFFSQLDAFSRYQNYKLVKDKIYQYGFDNRLLKPFIFSKCQRDAIAVAARDLNYTAEWNDLIKRNGFRWYQIIPQLVLRDPFVLFSMQYWNKTLFVKTYYSKYFLW